MAELVGSRDATKLLAEADDRFRAVSFDVLHEEDFASNRERDGAAAALRAHGARARRVQAFLSHSWSDDSAAK